MSKTDHFNILFIKMQIHINVAITNNENLDMLVMRTLSTEENHSIL